MNLNDIKTGTVAPKKNVAFDPSNDQQSIWDMEISFGGKGIPDKEKFGLYHQLHNLIDAGIDIRYAFEILENQIKNKKTKQKIAKIRAEVINGKALSNAMEDSGYFTKYEFYSIKIGEETGRLNEVLSQLYDFFEDKIAQRRQVISALSYPVLILLSSVGAVSFMMFLIIPMFEGIFKRFGSKLPWITEVILAISQFLQQNFWYFLLGILLMIGLNKYFSNNKKYQSFKEGIILKTPVFGGLYQSIYLARFCTSMSLLVKSEVPIINALEMVKNMINFQHLEKPINIIREEIINGSSLHKSMQSFSIFDHEMLGLIKVGEEVNRLGDFFHKLANNYTENVKHRTAILGTVLEPAMIIFLGLIVAVILVAMYLPMFELSSNVG